jgi:hypothetical protein
MQKSVYDLTEEELLNGTDSAPGRVRTFLLEPEKATTPHSCTLFVWNGDLVDCLQFCARALKGGAGVKLIFPAKTQLINLLDYCNSAIYLNELNGGGKEGWDFDRSFKLLNLNVADSMEGDYGILSSWATFIYYAKQGYSIDVFLGLLRAKGSVNDRGLIASGAESFALIYEAIAHYLTTGTIFSLLQLLGTLNDVIRRGNQYKNGIITSSMDYRCPLIKDYLAAGITQIAGSHKKGVRIDEHLLKYPDLVNSICESCNKESTFLAKIQEPEIVNFYSTDRLGNQVIVRQTQAQAIYENVCQGLFLGDRGTCLIWRVNLGKCTIAQIVPAYLEATRKLCELHVTWREKVGSDRAAIYAPLGEDRQIGLDVMGMANLLALEGITYLEFADALEEFLGRRISLEDVAAEMLSDWLSGQPKVFQLIWSLTDAYYQSDVLAREFMRSRGLPVLDRIHTVEPAQNHSYETTDREGNTTCRGIFAPIGRMVNRTSNTQASKVVYHGDVEIASEVGAQLHQRICELWQRLMTAYGCPHAISFDTWEPITPDWMERFIKSPLQTKYYSEHESFNPHHLKKRALTATTEGVELETLMPTLSVEVLRELAKQPLQTEYYLDRPSRKNDQKGSGKNPRSLEEALLDVSTPIYLFELDDKDKDFDCEDEELPVCGVRPGECQTCAD